MNSPMPETETISVKAGTAVVLLAGPTASGKSRLAVELAQRHDGVVINADSMQVYRELRVLTARPSAEDEALAEHRLYGHVSAGTRYSVGTWLADIAPELAEARRAGRLAIVAGGTGLYFKALTEGLSPVPEIDAKIREHWRAAAGAEGPQALHRILAERDPIMAARLRPSDPQRIVRALEVLDTTGRSLFEWQTMRPPPLVPLAEAVPVVLAPPRAWLHARIAKRFDAMVRAGAAEEAAAILSRGLDPALPVMKAIGVRPLAAAVRGDFSLDAAIEIAKTETRRYAKRQETFFRGQFPDWPRIDPSSAGTERHAAEILGCS